IIGVAVVWTKDGDRQARVENRRSGNLPASEHGVYRSVGAAAVIFAAPERNFVYAYEVQAVANVHCGRTVVRVEIVTILDGESIKAGISYRIVTRRISQRLGIGVVERVFKTTMSSLTQADLARVISHPGLG